MAAQGGKTKYPVLMVHGVGFRDLRRPLYWGRIPSGLSLQGSKKAPYCYDAFVWI